MTLTHPTVAAQNRAGAHGSVFLARLDSNEEEVAVKQVLIDGLSDRNMAGLIENEITMNQSLCHPNIVRYLGTHNCGNCLNIILEYCARGSLRQMLQADGAPPSCPCPPMSATPCSRTHVRIFF